jgi:RNA polymerase sigma factor (sigma-70 family)
LALDKTDTQLIEMACGGDKDAFGVLSERYRLPLQRFALRLSRDGESPPDLAQEALVQAYLNISKLHDPVRFKSWLYGIMLNVCRHTFRTRRVTNFSLEAIIEGLNFFPAPFSAPVLTPQQAAEEKEQYEVILNAVNMLSNTDRNIILLFYYAQMSIPEIVMMMNIPAGTVKVRLHRARQRLKTLLQEEFPEIVPPEKRRKIMVKVTVADVIPVEIKEAEEPLNKQYVIVLYDEPGRRVLPIWVGVAEGEAIAIGLSDMAIARPLTHRFFSTLLQGINASIEEVSVSALKVNTFYGLVKLRSGKKTVEIDARPSDAIALAILNNAPILIAEEVLETAGVDVPASAKGKPNHKNLTKVIKALDEKKRKAEARLSQSPKPPELSKEDKAKRDKDIIAMFGE